VHPAGMQGAAASEHEARHSRSLHRSAHDTCMLHPSFIQAFSSSGSRVQKGEPRTAGRQPAAGSHFSWQSKHPVPRTNNNRQNISRGGGGRCTHVRWQGKGSKWDGGRGWESTGLEGKGPGRAGFGLRKTVVESDEVKDESKRRERGAEQRKGPTRAHARAEIVTGAFESSESWAVARVREWDGWVQGVEGGKGTGSCWEVRLRMRRKGRARKEEGSETQRVLAPRVSWCGSLWSKSEGRSRGGEGGTEAEERGGGKGTGGSDGSGALSDRGRLES